GALLPRVQFNSAYLMMIVAVLGTTISPYLFFWEASEEVEEMRGKAGDKPLRKSSGNEAGVQLRRIELDNWVGMGFSNLVAFFIMLSAAVTLHASGMKEINTAAQAAEALRPVAGDLTFLLF